jgi:hypothetical protein
VIDQDVLEAVPYLCVADKIELKRELRRIAALPAGSGLADTWCTHLPRGRDKEFHDLELAILRRVVGDFETLNEALADPWRGVAIAG